VAARSLAVAQARARKRCKSETTRFGARKLSIHWTAMERRRSDAGSICAVSGKYYAKLSKTLYDFHEILLAIR
jgi:hypothetical protein